MLSKCIITTLLVYAVKQLLLFHNEAVCLRIIESPFSSDRSSESAWRSINRSSSATGPRGDKFLTTNDEVRMGNKRPLPVQWDDDEFLSTDYLSADILQPSLKSTSGEELQDIEEPLERVKTTWRPKSNEWSSGGRRSTQRHRPGTGKLIFHGQINQNGSTKILDGVKLHINTHRPVTINRSSGFSPLVSYKILKDEEEKEEIEPNPHTLTKRTQEDFRLGRQSATAATVVKEESSSSEWRPIVVKNLSCQSDCKTGGKKAQKDDEHSLSRTLKTSYKVGEEETKLVEDPKDTTEMAKFSIKTSNKWKPIKKVEDSKKFAPSEDEDDSHRESAKPNSHRPSITLDDTPDVVEQSVITETPPKRSRKVKLDQPTTSHRELSATKADSRWTPVETTTTTPPAIETSTDRESSPMVSSNSSSGGHHLDSAQKSASDLNYIYSSSAQNQNPSIQSSDWLSGSRQSYSSYQQPGGYATSDMQSNPYTGGGTIVDSTSGQQPEMISDRDPIQDFGSYPSSPGRYPQSGRYPYDTGYGGSYYGSGSRAQPTAARSAPPQTTLAPPVRQEHHYHYYNQQQPSNDRQQPVAQQPPASQVIRELQPLLISQPIIQQQPAPPTSTQAPSIIREIIKEVPVQSIYGPPRTIMVPPPPPPPPILPTRELDPYGPSYSPQRIIRQLPSAVAARMPQIRLSIPTIQLPATRLAPAPPAPVGITRQTGSFIIPPVPQKTTTYLTETQAMPTHTTIMHTTQFTPATRTTVYTTDHQPAPQPFAAPAPAYRRRR